MRDLYSDDYESVAVGDADRLIPEGVRRLAGAAVFLGLVGALGLWSYRLGTRDAGEVPIIRAMEGPARVEPEDPGGLQAAHQGLEVNAVLAGRPAPMPRDAAAGRACAGRAGRGGRAAGRAGARRARGAGRAGARRGRGPADAAAGGGCAGADGLGLAAPDADAELAADADAAPAITGPRPRSRPGQPPGGAGKDRHRSASRRSGAGSRPSPPSAEPAPTQVAAAAAPAHEVSGVRSGARLVQLGAFDSEEITRKAWDQLVARNGDLLGSKSLYVERTTSNARVFYRLRVAGFDERRPDPPDVRGAAVPRRRLHPGDPAIDGARAVIFGCDGPALDEAERRFFAAADPWGFILFARNIESPAQLRRLTADLRDAVGRDAPVLIDQEGGRVARLRGPDWREWAPALEECERLPGRELRARAMYLRYRLIAGELRAVGIDVNCAPVLDLARPETHAVIRNRCYGDDPAEVAAIGRAVADGLLAGGVLPVMKHVPGQGRAALDSHSDLPVVAADAGGAGGRLRAVPGARRPADGDDRPRRLHGARRRARRPPSRLRWCGLIREEIGFGGLLMTDDLSMQALRGSFAERAGRALAAGCDVVLHCNGDPAEMAEVAEAAPRLAGLPAERAAAALARSGAVPADDAGGDRGGVRGAAGAGRCLTTSSTPTPPPRGWPPRRWSSTSTASRGRSTCC